MIWFFLGWYSTGEETEPEAAGGGSYFSDYFLLENFVWGSEFLIEPEDLS